MFAACACDDSGSGTGPRCCLASMCKQLKLSLLAQHLLGSTETGLSCRRRHDRKVSLVLQCAISGWEKSILSPKPILHLLKMNDGVIVRPSPWTVPFALSSSLIMFPSSLCTIPNAAIKDEMLEVLKSDCAITRTHEGWADLGPNQLDYIVPLS